MYVSRVLLDHGSSGFTEDDEKAITAVSIVAGVLSLLGSVFIIWCVIWFEKVPIPPRERTRSDHL